MFFPSLQANFPNSLHVWLVSIKSVQGRVHHFCEIYCHSLNWLFLFLVVFFWGLFLMNGRQKQEYFRRIKVAVLILKETWNYNRPQMRTHTRMHPRTSSIHVKYRNCNRPWIKMTLWIHKNQGALLHIESQFWQTEHWFPFQCSAYIYIHYLHIHWSIDNKATLNPDIEQISNIKHMHGLLHHVPLLVTGETNFFRQINSQSLNISIRCNNNTN